MEKPEPNRSRPTLVRDISTAPSIGAQIVNDIPVQSPTQPGQLAASTPSVYPNQFPQPQIITPASVSDDKELDQILKDVNKSVKKSESAAEAKHSAQKATTSKGVVKQPHTKPRPIVATIVACLVALTLIIGAVLAFKE